MLKADHKEMSKVILGGCLGGGMQPNTDSDIAID